MLIQVSVAWGNYEYFYPLPPPPPDGMLVQRRAAPTIKLAGSHLYNWVERGTMTVKCPAREHNTMFPARAQPGPLKLK